MMTIKEQEISARRLGESGISDRRFRECCSYFLYEF